MTSKQKGRPPSREHPCNMRLSIEPPLPHDHQATQPEDTARLRQFVQDAAHGPGTSRAITRVDQLTPLADIALKLGIALMHHVLVEIQVVHGCPPILRG